MERPPTGSDGFESFAEYAKAVRAAETGPPDPRLRPAPGGIGPDGGFIFANAEEGAEFARQMVERLDTRGGCHRLDGKPPAHEQVDLFGPGMVIDLNADAGGQQLTPAPPRPRPVWELVSFELDNQKYTHVHQVAYARPNWLRRLLVRLLLGWEWRQA